MVKNEFKGVLYTTEEGGLLKEYRCTDRDSRNIINQVKKSRPKKLNTTEASIWFNRNHEKIKQTVFPDGSKKTVFYCLIRNGQDFDFVLGSSRNAFVRSKGR